MKYSELKFVEMLEISMEDKTYVVVSYCVIFVKLFMCRNFCSNFILQYCI